MPSDYRATVLCVLIVAIGCVSVSGAATWWALAAAAAVLAVCLIPPVPLEAAVPGTVIASILVGFALQGAGFGTALSVGVPVAAAVALGAGARPVVWVLAALGALTLVTGLQPATVSPMLWWLSASASALAGVAAVWRIVAWRTADSPPIQQAGGGTVSTLRRSPQPAGSLRRAA